MSLRVLVVDDSPFIRRILSDWIAADPDLELAGTARDGMEAFHLAAALKPDVITLDVEMPICDGITALPKLLKHCNSILMVSSITTQGADATIKALELGAYDFVTKPQGSSSLKMLSSKDELLAKVKIAKELKFQRRIAAPKEPARIQKLTTDKIVVIASSTGGPGTLTELFQRLPKGFPAPILMVQHMPQGFTASFARRLDSLQTVPCMEATDGEKIVAGLSLIAPGGRHMVITRDHRIALNDDPNMHGTRPAADPLFHSVVKEYGSRVVGVVLTGMGKDGAAGAKEIVDAGGYVIGQDAATSTIYGMPKAAFEAGGISIQLPIQEIADHLVQVVTKGVARAS